MSMSSKWLIVAYEPGSALGIDPDSVKAENRNGKPPAAVAVRQ